MLISYQSNEIYLCKFQIVRAFSKLQLESVIKEHMFS
jgi:hypothetical protein